MGPKASNGSSVAIDEPFEILAKNRYNCSKMLRFNILKFIFIMLYYIFIFAVGGLITLAITYFETSGFPLLSRLAALFPVFTWISYLFIGKLSGSEAVSKHSLFVLLGTLFAWVPYMLAIYFLAPRIGSLKAILAAILIFVVLAVIFIKIYKV
jgi:uncharacterized membrane protein (GlpM family)